MKEYKYINIFDFQKFQNTNLLTALKTANIVANRKINSDLPPEKSLFLVTHLPIWLAQDGRTFRAGSPALLLLEDEVVRRLMLQWVSLTGPHRDHPPGMDSHAGREAVHGDGMTSDLLLQHVVTELDVLLTGYDVQKLCQQTESNK